MVHIPDLLSLMLTPHNSVLQDEQPSGATADYADLTARLRNTTLSGGQILTPGSISGCGSFAIPSRDPPCPVQLHELATQFRKSVSSALQ